MESPIETIKQAVKQDVSRAYERLVPGPQHRAPDGFKLTCPLHGGGAERSPSFHVYDDGHFFCFGCREGGDFIDLVRKLRHSPDARTAAQEAASLLGVPWPAASRGKPAGERSPTATSRPAAARPTPPRRYSIRGLDYVEVAVHIRCEPPDGEKTFAWESRGRPGLGGLKVERLPLYNTHLLPHVPADGAVFITEGEKAADALTGFGCMALATVTGAAGCPHASVLEPLRDRQVVLWPDNDDVGRAHMLKLAKRLHGVGAHVWLLTWQTDLPGADAADYVAGVGGGDAPAPGADLMQDERITTRPYAPATGDQVATLSQVAAKLPATTWLWDQWIPHGYVTVLGGVPGVGKSGIALGLAKTYLCDLHWPDGTAVRNGPPDQRRVLWLETEDSHGILRDRAHSWGLPADQILLWGGDGFDRPALDKPGILDTLCEVVQEHGVGFVVLDTLSGAHYQEENSANIKRIIQVLSELATQTGVAVLALHHLRKTREGEGDDISLDRLRGSTAIAAQARVVLAVRPDRLVSDGARLVVLKSNMVDEKPAALVSCLYADGPVWVVGHGDGLGDGVAPALSRREADKEALRQALPPLTDMRTQDVVARLSAEHDLSPDRIKAARAALGVRWYRQGADYMLVRDPLPGELEGTYTPPTPQAPAQASPGAAEEAPQAPPTPCAPSTAPCRDQAV